MKFKERVADLSLDGQILLDIDNKAFNRPFDNPSSSIEEEIEFLKGAETHIWLDGDKPIGFFSFKKTGDEVELKTVAVVPEHQGHRFGRYMVERFLEINDDYDCWLVVHPKNWLAILLYLRKGFEIDEWKENYYRDGQPRLVMKRKQGTSF